MPIYLVQKLRVIDIVALRYRNTELRGHIYTVTPPKVMNYLSLSLSYLWYCHTVGSHAVDSL